MSAASEPSRAGTSTTPPPSGGATLATTVTPMGSEELAERLESERGIVVAGDHDDRDAGLVRGARGSRTRARPPPAPRRADRRRRRRQHRVDALVHGDARDLAERRRELRRVASAPGSPCRRASPRCAAGASGQSASNGRNGSASAGAAASSARVAHAGNGNRICSGTGMCGCCRIIDPGLRIDRAGPGHRGQEPVLASLGLRGVEPPHHAERGVGDDPALDLARGLLRADQDHPERSTALGDVEQDLLDRAPVPSRGAYRFSSSRTRNVSGSRRPSAPCARTAA